MKFDSIEDLGIVLVGVFMHLQRLSPFGVNDPKAVQLVPNAASTLAATTLLTALIKWRPICALWRGLLHSQQEWGPLIIRLATLNDSRA